MKSVCSQAKELGARCGVVLIECTDMKTKGLSYLAKLEDFIKSINSYR